MIENRFAEHYSSSGPSNINQHYQQHFQQHYAATENASGFSTAHHVHQSNDISQASPLSNYETHSQMIHSDQNGNIQQIEKHEQKKTVHTTTTTTMTQPVVLGEDSEMLGVHQIPIYNQKSDIEAGLIETNSNYNNNTFDTNNNNNKIYIEHYPENNNLIWDNLDTYLHIFLTFYFGHFAAILFFDGIIRNIAYLYVLEHRGLSPLIYILQIILSVFLIAFTIWFMTICWRWWRNKSLIPNGFNLTQTLGPKDRKLQVYGFVFTAAMILIITLFIYFILGFLDLSFKKDIENDYYLKYGHKRAHFFTVDVAVYVFRLIFWIIGIIACLLLSRDLLYKYCCPSRRIKINKEKPTTVYEIRN